MKRKQQKINLDSNLRTKEVSKNSFLFCWVAFQLQLQPIQQAHGHLPLLYWNWKVVGGANSRVGIHIHFWHINLELKKLCMYISRQTNVPKSTFSSHITKDVSVGRDSQLIEFRCYRKFQRVQIQWIAGSNKQFLNCRIYWASYHLQGKSTSFSKEYLDRQDLKGISQNHHSNL